MMTVVPCKDKSGVEEMDQTTVRICMPSEAVSMGILGQAIHIDDKCYIIRSIALSDSDSSMVNLFGVLKSEKKRRQHNPPTQFSRRLTDASDQS